MPNPKTSAEAALDARMKELGLTETGGLITAGDAIPVNEPPVEVVAEPHEVEAGDGEGEGTPQPPKHNWEKRARDNQRQFAHERNARIQTESALTKALEEIREQREEFKRLLEQFQPNSAHRVPDQNEQLDEFRQTFPDLAEGVEKMVEPLKKRIAEFEEERGARVAREQTERFLAEAAKDPRLKGVDVNSLIGSEEMIQWIEDTGGYVARVMNHTFDPAFGFTPSDVAEVIHRFVSEKGKKLVATTVETQPPAARPPVPRGGSTLPNGAGNADVFSQEDMGRLRVIADQIGKQAAKLGKPELLDQFDAKLERSIRYYDDLSRRRPQTA